MKRMDYIIILIICVVAYIAFQLIKRNNDDSASRSYESKQKELISNSNLILIENVSYESIKKAVQDFTKMYSNRDRAQLSPMSRLHKVENKQTVITFPYDIDFELFCYMINYLKYPSNIKYDAKVIGWALTNKSDKWLNGKFENEEVMIYIDPDDNEYDNVILTTMNNRTYKIGFALGEGLQVLNSTIIDYQSSDFKQSELEKLESELIE